MVKDENLTYISEEFKESGEIKPLKSKELKLKLKECQKEKEEYLTQAQIARADLINFRRRQEKILEELKKYGQEDLIKELLPVLDSLEIGAKKNHDLNQIKEQLKDILKKYGLKVIKTKGEKFNPEFHEAIEQIESKEQEGSIVKEIQKGYIIENKILRASKVKIAK